MPPQPGMFALPYASTHKARADVIQPDNMSMTISYQHQPHIQAQGQLQGSGPHIHHVHHHAPVAGPSTRTHDDPKKDKKRKDISGKVGKEMSDRRDEGRQFTENISALHSAAIQLASRPETHPLYNLRLYPLSLERSALLAQVAYEEKHNYAAIQTAYEDERERVEDEWRKGRDRVRERLLEGIEERRRRAREEKEGEGAVNDVSLDSQSRTHITRKLRNKVGTSPPPTPLGLSGLSLANGSTTPITSGPFTNPHSLSVDEIPSPFPFPLTSVTLNNGHHATSGGGGGGSNGSRRRNKAGGSHPSMVGVGGLGKSLAFLGSSKDTEIEADLIEIRRGTKRRRAAAISSTKVS
ncbi:hypothetical protein HYDPIDRAFT_111082 [Hydnomerulius pinastri MD-312]|uniref:Centrosomal protein ATPase n=1 Tax=Hydnomerulius pinastri MD-312 TaxID=994086 RepID=A0A0C9WAZ8_9AGAM|nr:hypothetical protein HYDPIDRAFT_111082 [Hydnomerulius pinastri MD-312]